MIPQRQMFFDVLMSWRTLVKLPVVDVVLLISAKKRSIRFSQELPVGVK